MFIQGLLLDSGISLRIEDRRHDTDLKVCPTPAGYKAEQSCSPFYFLNVHVKCKQSQQGWRIQLNCSAQVLFLKRIVAWHPPNLPTRS